MRLMQDSLWAALGSRQDKGLGLGSGVGLHFASARIRKRLEEWNCGLGAESRQYKFQFDYFISQAGLHSDALTLLETHQSHQAESIQLGTAMNTKDKQANLVGETSINEALKA
ncbi:hypothetical protein VTL71DRAFT_16375 [Oculimacula yallundae]|uniref:Uncharacterized protein n=1 Tax=Oculimacula yallundae TaxID=86028 RepID=A0ABR4CEY9_9HELO